MLELIGLLGAQLDVLCRRHEESNGPVTATPTVSGSVCESDNDSGSGCMSGIVIGSDSGSGCMSGSRPC